jgi:hypothetical protein
MPLSFLSVHKPEVLCKLAPRLCKLVIMLYKLVIKLCKQYDYDSFSIYKFSRWNGII